MAPEAAVLSLHAHHHTVEVAPPSTKHKLAGGQASVSAQHQHCHAEQLYNAAFQPALPIRASLPHIQLHYSEYQALIAVCPPLHLLPGAALRGPPAA